MSHIFISYSRKDLAAAEKIIAALAIDDLEPWIDWKSIPKGEAFWLEIQQGIEEADVFLFLISPDSAQSDWCNKEIDYAVKNGKRILPIVLRDTDLKLIHSEISKRNWILCREGLDDFNKAIEETHRTIHTDYEWLKFHTDLQVKALNWEKKGDNGRLLRGKELQEAEEQLNIDSSKEPYPTNLQRKFILASRKATERQIKTVTILSAVVAVVMLGLAIFGVNKATEATNQRSIAQGNAIEAQANALTAQAASTLAVANAFTAQANAEDAQNAEETAIANEAEAKKQALLALSEKISTLALSQINSDFMNALLLQQESVRILDLNGMTSEHQSDALPIFLQEIQSGWTRTLINPPSGNVRKICYSQDGKWMVSASNSVDLWDTSNPLSPKLIKSWSNLKYSATDVAFDPTGAYLAVGYWDGNVDLWRISDLTKVVNFSAYQSISQTDVRVAFSVDGKSIAISGNTKLSLWDIANPYFPIKLHEFSTPHTYHNIIDLFFSPAYQNRLVSIGDDNVVHIWDIQDPQNPILHTSFGQNNIISRAISPDKKYGFVFASDRYLYFYNSQFVKISDFYYINDQPEPIYYMSFQPTKQRLFTASGDGSIAIWDVSSPQHTLLIKKINPHSNRIDSMAFHPDGNVLASGGYDSKIVIWNVSEGVIPDMWQDYIPSNIKITAIAYSSKNALLTLGYDNGNVQLRNISELRHFLKPRDIPIPNQLQPVKQLQFDPTEDRLVALGEPFANYTPTVYMHGLVNLDYTKYKFLFQLNSSDFFVFNKEYILAGEDIGNSEIAIYPWNISNLSRPIKEKRLDVVKCPSYDTSMTHDGDLVAVASCSIQLWDFSDDRTPSIIAELYPYSPRGVAFSKDGKMLASANGDNSITLWSIFVNKETKPLSVSYKLLTTISNAHLRPVTSVAFSPDDKTLASGGTDQSVILWDITNAQEPTKRFILKGHTSAILDGGLFFMSDGKSLISASQNEVILWDINPLSWAEKACAVVGRNFTQTEWKQYIGENIPYHATCPDLPVPTE